MAETELRKICDGILAFMTEDVVPSTSIRESKVVYCKMKGVVHFLHLQHAGVRKEQQKACTSTPGSVLQRSESTRYELCDTSQHGSVAVRCSSRNVTSRRPCRPPHNHSGQERFPVMTTSYTLVQLVEKMHEKSNKVRSIITAKSQSEDVPAV